MRSVALLVVVCIASGGWLVGAFAPLNYLHVAQPRLPSRHRTATLVRAALLYQKNQTYDQAVVKHRFDRTADPVQQVNQPCILTIDGGRYNVTAWAKAHPGGVRVLERFHDKDATKAFQAAHHSAAAVELLKSFAIEKASAPKITMSSTQPNVPHWRAKLFTKEDPIGVHKYLGVFVLLHFCFRFAQMYFGDPSAGLGTAWERDRAGFQSRVVGKPMIWKEYRVHNIAFGLRSVLTAALCAVSLHFGNTPAMRQLAVWGSTASCLTAMVVADLATKYLRANDVESTTATMPYWEGCSLENQKRFKSFYAYCQFLATLACLSVTNPAWPLSVLLAIQMASLLMTLVRKGLLSARGYHIGYTATLVAPYLVGFRSFFYVRSHDIFYMFALGGLLYQLRRRGVNKYVLWSPVFVWRVLYGDQFLQWSCW